MGHIGRTANCHRCSAAILISLGVIVQTCGEKCAMCQYCSLLGCSRSLFFPFSFVLKPLSEGKKTCHFICAKLPHSLTEKASNKQFTRSDSSYYNRSEKSTVVLGSIWAGKTECLVPIIETICDKVEGFFGSPHAKDVVLELAPR